MQDGDEKPRVLVVDDTMIMRKKLITLLEAHGFEIAGQAADGAEALDVFRRVHPDLVLLDIIMPEVDGLETLRRMLEEDPEAKVVMVTSAGTRDNVMEALRRGARNFIVKPYEKRKVIEIIRRALSEEAS